MSTTTNVPWPRAGCVGRTSKIKLVLLCNITEGKNGRKFRNERLFDQEIDVKNVDVTCYVVFVLICVGVFKAKHEYEFLCHKYTLRIDLIAH